MARGGAGSMLGVGGTRRNLGRGALRGGGAGRIGGGADPDPRKKELLRRLREREEQRRGGEPADGSP
ncbi:DUF6243 family protein [Streptomyces zinciresistens]|nr:DUF6243 family protein [Streptomyces zinciresistens]